LGAKRTAAILLHGVEPGVRKGQALPDARRPCFVQVLANPRRGLFEHTPVSWRCPIPNGAWQPAAQGWPHLKGLQIAAQCGSGTSGERWSYRGARTSSLV